MGGRSREALMTGESKTLSCPCPSLPALTTMALLQEFLPFSEAFIPSPLPLYFRFLKESAGGMEWHCSKREENNQRPGDGNAKVQWACGLQSFWWIRIPALIHQSFGECTLLVSKRMLLQCAVTKSMRLKPVTSAASSAEVVDVSRSQEDLNVKDAEKSTWPWMPTVPVF